MSTRLVQLADEFVNLDHIAYAQLQEDEKAEGQILFVALMSGQQFRYDGEKMQALLAVLRDQAEVALEYKPPDD